MKTTLNLNKAEAQCLQKLIENFIKKADGDVYPQAFRVCRPFIDTLKSKVDELLKEK